LFRAWRTGRGNKAARPGKSNHQSGRALDIAVISVPGALAWLESNAAGFGFKRTVASEPWHWEYVESPIAARATKRKTKRAKSGGHAKRPSSSSARARNRVASQR
jgi:LAS superfamily LD-carboxypeptidase LdcB